MTQPILAQPPVAEFDVHLAPPDISPWREGNTGIAGVTTFHSGVPGPHVALFALTHGNEIAGAIVLDRLLRARLRPVRGALTFAFLNLAAFNRFDPKQPTLSRFVDEDLNRLWDPDLLDSGRMSVELGRAREIRPVIDTVDVLLDLHSMLWPSDPLMLCGGSARGRLLATGIGAPGLMVADHGHVAGRRIIDYPRFTDPASGAAANLVEAGQHWEPKTVAMVEASVSGLLHHLQLVDNIILSPSSTPTAMRFANVTAAVTAGTANFSFVHAYRGGDVIGRRNTLIAMDGAREVRTTYDDCLLVMPSLRPSRGHTAVRLAQFAE